MLDRVCVYRLTLPGDLRRQDRGKNYEDDGGKSAKVLGQWLPRLCCDETASIIGKLPYDENLVSGFYKRG